MIFLKNKKLKVTLDNVEQEAKTEMNTFSKQALQVKFKVYLKN